MMAGMAIGGAFGQNIAGMVNSTMNRYIIDKFDISEYDAQALAAGRNEGHSAENKAAREIVRFLQKT